MTGTYTLPAQPALVLPVLVVYTECHLWMFS